MSPSPEELAKWNKILARKGLGMLRGKQLPKKEATGKLVVRSSTRTTPPRAR